MARTLGDRDAAILRGHGSIVVGESIEWTFAACIDLEESAARLCFASLPGPVHFYTDDEVQRVAKSRRRRVVIQKVWDHYVAKAKLTGLIENI